MLTTPEVLERTGLSIEDILRDATSEIDVLAILRDGEIYARSILQQLQGKGKLFGIDPYNKSCSIEPQSVRIYPLTELGEELPYSNSLEFVSWYDGLTKRRPKGLPNVNPENTLVVCDDYLFSGNTLRCVAGYLERIGYNFNNDNPPHFGTMESIEYRDDCGRGIVRHHIGLVRDLLFLEYH